MFHLAAFHLSVPHLSVSQPITALLSLLQRTQRQKCWATSLLQVRSSPPRSLTIPLSPRLPSQRLTQVP